jgi:integrin beta 2
MMYFVAGGVIQKASLEGTNVEVLHSNNIVNPHGLALDIKTQTLYWANRGSFQRLESSNVDGTNRMVIAEVGFDTYDLAITSNGVLYYSAAGSEIIQRLDSRNGNATTVLSASTTLLGLQVFDPLNQILGS